MAYTPIYNKALLETARYGLKLRRERSEEDVREIFEAWLTASVAGLVDLMGWDAARDLLKHKMGELPVPASKPRLIVDNTAPVEPPCDVCA